MPKVPVYEGSQQISPGSGQELQSAREAVSQGLSGSLAQFGEGLQAVGVQQLREDSAVETALLKEKEAKKKTTDDLTKERFEQGAVEAAIIAKRNAYKNTDPAGDMLVPGFNQEYDKWVEKNLKGLPDDQLKFSIQSKLYEIRNTYNGSLEEDARKMFKDNAIKGYEDALNFRSAMVRRNPLDYDKNVAEYNNLILNSQFDATNKMKAMKLGREEMAREAIGGLTDTGKYEIAKKVMVSKFASVFNQKDRESILKDIDAQEEQATKQKLQEIALSEKKNEKQLKLDREATYEDLVGFISEYQNASEGERGAPGESIKAMDKTIAEKEALGLLTPTAANNLKKMMRDSAKPDQDMAAHVLHEKFADVTSLKELEKFQAEVDDEFRKGNIGKETSIPLLDLIRTAKKQAKSKAPVDKLNTKIMSELMKDINTMASADIVDRKLDPGKIAANRNAAATEAWTLFYKGGKGIAGNGAAVTDRIFKKFYPEFKNGRIPYVPADQQNLDYRDDDEKFNKELNRIRDDIVRRKNSKELKESEAIEALEALKIKSRYRQNKKALEEEKK